MKAFLFVWGLEIRSAVSCCLWEVRKPLLALRPPPTWPGRGAEAAAGGRALSSFLQRPEGETEAQRSRWPAGVPQLAPELRVGSTLAFTFLQPRRDPPTVTRKLPDFLPLNSCPIREEGPGARRV